MPRDVAVSCRFARVSDSTCGWLFHVSRYFTPEFNSNPIPRGLTEWKVSFSYSQLTSPASANLAANLPCQECTKNTKLIIKPFFVVLCNEWWHLIIENPWSSKFKFTFSENHHACITNKKVPLPNVHHSMCRCTGDVICKSVLLLLYHVHFNVIHNFSRHRRENILYFRRIPAEYSSTSWDVCDPLGANSVWVANW